MTRRRVFSDASKAIEAVSALFGCEPASRSGCTEAPRAVKRRVLSMRSDSGTMVIMQVPRKRMLRFSAELPLTRSYEPSRVSLLPQCLKVPIEEVFGVPAAEVAADFEEKFVLGGDIARWRAQTDPAPLHRPAGPPRQGVVPWLPRNAHRAGLGGLHGASARSRYAALRPQRTAFVSVLSSVAGVGGRTRASSARRQWRWGLRSLGAAS